MLTLYQSQTLPINPPGASPIVTVNQLWEVMLLKLRKPQLFIEPMSNCEVITSTPTFMKRIVTFKEGMGPPSGKVTEELEIRAPWKVDFRQLETGAFINNTISQGKDETDLYLTFYFEWPYPKMEEGSKEAAEAQGQLWKLAKQTVQETIDHAREMVRDGKA